MSVNKLKETLSNLNQDFKNAECPADASITKIHINLCGQVLKKKMSDISVIGLGKLGSPMVSCLASRGFKVIGVDVDKTKVDAINNRIAPVSETGLQDLLQYGDYSATQDIEQAVLETSITFIIVATPSGADGKFSLEYVLPVCEKIGNSLRKKDSFHVVVITSTVMPGDCDGPILETLEKTSGLKCGEGFGLCYNPEFIALGSVIRDFLNPDFLLLGTSDPLSECRVRQVYEKVCPNAPIKSMSRINAELTKLAVNTFLCTKISYGNMLSRICQNIPGADCDVVSNAVGSDSRIGSKCLKGGVSYGGPCLPRDTKAMATLGQSFPLVVDAFNRHQITWLADFVQQRAKGSVTILGLSYKIGTDITEESPGLLLQQELETRNVLLARTYLGDTIVVVQPCPEYKEFDYSGKTVIDCWRFLKYLQNDPSVVYIPLGIGK